MIAKDEYGEVVIQCFPKKQDYSGYTVTITDWCGNLIGCGKTCKIGFFSFRVPVLGEYHIKVEASGRFSPKVAHRWVRLCPYSCCMLFFVFHKQIVVKTATFTLTDRHYEGLPIQKGELILCPAPILFR